MTSQKCSLAAEHRSNEWQWCQFWASLEKNFITKTCTLEAETSVSDYTQCKVLLALTKNVFWSDLLEEGKAFHTPLSASGVRPQYKQQSKPYCPYEKTIKLFFFGANENKMMLKWPWPFFVVFRITWLKSYIDPLQEQIAGVLVPNL